MTDMFHLKAIEIILKSLRGAVEGTKEGRRREWLLDSTLPYGILRRWTGNRSFDGSHVRSCL